jgi:GTP cyclohydrolase I
MSVAFDTCAIKNSHGAPSNGRGKASAPANRDESKQASNVSNQPSAPEGNPVVDLEAIKGAVRTILLAVGEDPDREGLLETPRRVAKMYAEMFEGLTLDPGRHLDVTFPESYDEIVLVRDIPFTSMCEHHLLPFTGVAHVAYLPNGRVTGLSKLARVVEEVSRRPQVQERMTLTIADLIESKLDSKGVAVVVQAEHSCMSIRGVKKHGASTVTSALRGVFKTNQASRAEVMTLITNG